MLGSYTRWRLIVAIVNHTFSGCVLSGTNIVVSSITWMTKIHILKARIIHNLNFKVIKAQNNIEATIKHILKQVI